MASFKSRFTFLLDGLLWNEQDPDIPGPCSREGCTREAKYRCKECSQRAPLCGPCTVLAHRHLPLHWVDEWNGSWFQRRDLSALGFIIHLGHRGHPCPNVIDRTDTTDFVIVHENGVHKCRIKYCKCILGVEPHAQLLHAGYFPATLERTESAFTVDVLEDYILDFAISKKSAQDYVRRLVRKTDAWCPEDVPVCLEWLILVR